MNPFLMIAKALSESEAETPEAAGEHVCAVTGETLPCVRRKDSFSEGFTNQDRLACPGSDWVSVQAYRVLKYKWERMSSWWCDGSEFKRLDRQSVRQLVLDGSASTPWLGYCTTSYKKHGAFYTRVNHGRHGWWRFEMLDVDCTKHDLVLDWWRMLRLFQDIGISRGWLEACGADGAYIDKKVGVGDRLQAYEWCRTRKGDPLFKFLCYLLPSKEELGAMVQAPVVEPTKEASKGQLSLF